jgi:hypothetical protein
LVGDDDANVGGPGECPNHEWLMLELVPVKDEASPFGAVGLGQLMECIWCEAQRYEPSINELPPDHHAAPALAGNDEGPRPTWSGALLRE